MGKPHRTAAAVAAVAITAAIAALTTVAVARRPGRFAKLEHWSKSFYGRLLHRCRCNLSDLDHLKAVDEFRKTLSIPYEVFVVIEDAYTTDYPITTSTTIDNGIKVMGALSKLTSAASYKIVSICCNLSEEVIRKTLHLLLIVIVDKLFTEKVVYPTEENGLLSKTLKEYNAAGLPGCVGSVDCTHIPWGMCPSSEYNLFKNGKNTCPTVVFQVPAITPAVSLLALAASQAPGATPLSQSMMLSWLQLATKVGTTPIGTDYTILKETPI